jgi:hypothetical protein
MNEEQKKEFDLLAKKIMEFMAKNLHPHTTLLADSNKVEILEGICVCTNKLINNGTND